MFGPDFYPTPAPVIRQMLAKIDRDATYFLEPSAGKGDIATAIFEMGKYDRYADRSTKKVDCIEIQPELASILTAKGFPVVGYDWLEYPGVSYYDACVMNPPFSNGAAHLLRAWEFMHDGEIVCLLNEETINNPYTDERARLKAIIEKHGSVDFLGDCFTTAQRKTDVKVAMVYLKKVSDDDTVNLWARTNDEKDVDDSIGDDPCMLAIRDDLGNMEHWYNAANEHMFKAFAHLRKASLYMRANKITDRGGKEEEDTGATVVMALSNVNSARAEFSRMHRRNAWRGVFERMEFRKWLDHKQTEEFLRDIERSTDVPFTKENIKATLRNVWLQRNELFHKSVANVFDELTRYFNGNTTGAGGGGTGPSGWKTNDSYKVNEKLVFPYGLRYEGQYKAIGPWGMHYGRDTDIYNDLDRILCVLDVEPFENCVTIGAALDDAFKHLNHSGRTSASRYFHDGTDDKELAMKQQARSNYFDIRFFKKGTVHLKFRDRELWQKFNIAAAKGKNWIGENTQGQRKPKTRPSPDTGFVIQDEGQQTLFT